MKVHHQQQASIRGLQLQKQMSTAAPFTAAQVIAQANLLQAAQLQAFGDASKFITDLQAAVAAGNPVTQDQLNTLGALMTSMTTSTQAFDVANSEPVVPIPPPPPVVLASA
jgi:hypothetical protein